MQLCAITDRRSLGPNEEQRTAGLLALAASWARGGVDYIQVREKDLDPAALASLVRRLLAARPPRSAVKILVNGSATLALAAGADGVHLPGNPAAYAIPEAIAGARLIFAPQSVIVSVACHSIPEIIQAQGADLILFAPVFGKLLESGEALPGQGLDKLTAACRAAGPTPVFALGGVNAANAQSCADAGAAGVAAIRLFAGEDWRTLRARLATPNK